METTHTTSIDRRISDLEEKSTRIKEAKSLEDNIDSATGSFRKLRKRIDSVEETAEELQFYIEVLETVFGDTRPKSVDMTLSSARNRVNITDDELLEAAENLEFATLYEELNSVENNLESACREVKKAIKQNYTEPWQSELSSARELNRIIGGRNDDFNRLIREIELFVTKEIYTLSNTSRALSDEWDDLTRRWDENAGKHGWDAFKEEHDLSQETVDELKQFSSKDTVRLSDLSLDTIEEIKTVEELESALEVRIQS